MNKLMINRLSLYRQKKKKKNYSSLETRAAIAEGTFAGSATPGPNEVKTAFAVGDVVYLQTTDNDGTTDDNFALYPGTNGALVENAIIKLNNAIDASTVSGINKEWQWKTIGARPVKK